MARSSENVSPELLQKTALVTDALQRGVRAALLNHARNGVPACILRDGKLVQLSSEELLRYLATTAPALDVGNSVSTTQ